MGVKVAATCLQWSQSVTSHSSSSAQTIASAVLSPSSKKQRGGDRVLACQSVRKSPFLGTSSTKLLRSRSCDNVVKSRGQFLRRVCSANFDGCPDEEFAEIIRELAHLLSDDHREQSSNDQREDVDASAIESREEQSDGSSNVDNCSINSVRMPSSFQPSKLESAQPPWFYVKPEPPEWAKARDEIDRVDIERKANSVERPLSLRIKKKKIQWEEGIREAGESACCSMKKAFSSMVFIIRELQCYTLQLREILFYEDLQGIVSRVQMEMHASFVWLFQQVFSQTPTLMVYVMILLANFTVYSMGKDIAFAGPPPPPAAAVSFATEIVSVYEDQSRPGSLDSSSSPMIGKTDFVGGHNGNGGGGRGKLHRVMSGSAGDGPSDHSSSSFPRKYRPLSYETSFGNPFEAEEAELEESFVDRDPSKVGVTNEEEKKLWLALEDEAIRMQTEIRGEALADIDTIMDFVTPISVDIEPEYDSEYLRTELLYNRAVSEEPNNPMILANYAQFLYAVLHEHDRAEEYFKKAIVAGREGGGDAEALNKYAKFLWVARKDIEAAEERYVEAIEVEPGNTYHAASYAHFLWNTGGEDTCYPLDSLNNDLDEN